ncbi:MAG: hypothetical protein ACTSQP_01345 [Promethearchaeota archaeon]
MPKDPRINAERLINRAEHYYEVENYKKAGKGYQTAAEIYFDLYDFELARDFFFRAANCFLNEDKYELVLENIRSAGDSSLFMDDYLKAYQFFKSALKYVPYIKSSQNKDFYYILFSSLSYLSLFIKGKQEQGLNLIKEIKKKVDNEYFKQNPLIKLVKNLTIAIRDKKKEYLNKVEEEFEQYKFRKAEEKLIKEILVVAKAHILLKTSLSLDKEEYTTNDLIKLKLTIDTKPLLEISKYPFYNYEIKELKISNLGIALSENLINQEKPKLPIIAKPGEKITLDFVIRPNFQMDNPFIGPILLTCEIDNKFIFFLKTQSIIPNLISPPPTLDISLKNLRTPLLDQTFPMEILVENKSEGEALNISIEFELPKQLKLIRGTNKKQIFALRSNESLSWEVFLKPIEAGDYDITFYINFNDPDQNKIETVQKFPFSIKL